MSSIFDSYDEENIATDQMIRVKTIFIYDIIPNRRNN